LPQKAKQLKEEACTSKIFSNLKTNVNIAAFKSRENKQTHARTRTRILLRKKKVT